MRGNVDIVIPVLGELVPCRARRTIKELLVKSYWIFVPTKTTASFEAYSKPESYDNNNTLLDQTFPPLAIRYLTLSRVLHYFQIISALHLVSLI